MTDYGLQITDWGLSSTNYEVQMTVAARLLASGEGAESRRGFGLTGLTPNPSPKERGMTF